MVSYSLCGIFNQWNYLKSKKTLEITDTSYRDNIPIRNPLAKVYLDGM